jgi:hypothetical protein
MSGRDKRPLVREITKFSSSIKAWQRMVVEEFAHYLLRGVFKRFAGGAKAAPCESYWANWGVYRARVELADWATKKQCAPKDKYVPGMSTNGGTKK